jgi:hypothetical protein
MVIPLTHVALILKAKKNKRKTMMNDWISVDDRLPDDAELVLFRLLNRPKTDKGIWLAGCKTFETEYTCDYYFVEDVTHWIPLPPPPKESK